MAKRAARLAKIMQEAILSRSRPKRLCPAQQLDLFEQRLCDSHSSRLLAVNTRSKAKRIKPIAGDRWWCSFIPPTEAEWQQHLAEMAEVPK